MSYQAMERYGGTLNACNQVKEFLRAIYDIWEKAQLRRPQNKTKNNSSQGLEWPGGDYAGQEGFLGQRNYYF